MDSESSTRGLRLLLAALIGFSFVARSGACQRAILNPHGLSNFDKEKVLEMHNSLRQAVALGQIKGQPAAANMLEMQWDEELAQRAQKWATSCLSEHHDPQRQTSRFILGQNIATFWTSRKPSSIYDMMPNFSKAINGWFKEVNRYKFGKVDGSFQVGHYTQMTWARTNLVGCGYAYYLDKEKGFTESYVCNYGPAGNVISQPPYEKGFPGCTKFGLAFSNNWRGLCRKPTNYRLDFSNYIG